MRALKLLRYGAIFSWELMKANVEIAIAVLRPRLTFKPAILAVPVGCRSRLELTMLANSISLTPGTLVIDVSEDGRVLYVHAMFGEDPNAVRKAIHERLEKPIREIFA